MAMMFFVLLSFAEIPEPDWSELPIQAPVPKEISFDLDEHLREEVQRVRTQVYAEVKFMLTILLCKQNILYSGRVYLSRKTP